MPERNRGVEALADGQPLASLGDYFIYRVCLLKFIPIVERVIEAQHSKVSRGLRGKKKKRSVVLPKKKHKK